MVFGALLLVCAGLFAQNVSLDQAVQTSTQAIETRLPKGAKTAVLTFTSAKQAFSDYIVDELATALSASRNLQVIDRQHTDAIRKEFNIQFSGDVSDEEVKSIGKQLGAQYVVTGSLVDIGNAYRFRVAAINIETAVREGSSSLNININDPQVTFLLTGQRTTQTVNPSPSGFNQRGRATREMGGSGLYAAHARLPIGSKAYITNASNGRQVEVTIFNRIPASLLRVIDLSDSVWLALELRPGDDIIITTSSQ
jgi:TolB-like protein